LATGLRAQAIPASGLFEKLFEFLETPVPSIVKIAPKKNAEALTSAF